MCCAHFIFDLDLKIKLQTIMNINYSDDSLTEFGIDEMGIGEPYGSPSLGLFVNH